MKTLNWRHTDWNARRFVFSIGQEIIGQLTFNSPWNFNATYTDHETNLRFAQKGYWNKDTIVTRNGEVIGEISFGMFAIQTLTLRTGQRFTLSTSFFEQEAYWKAEDGTTVITYQQATLSSMGKGLISTHDSLPEEMKTLLISSGLFARQAWRKRIITAALMIMPVLLASRWLQ